MKQEILKIFLLIQGTTLEYVSKSPKSGCFDNLWLPECSCVWAHLAERWRLRVNKVMLSA